MGERGFEPTSIKLASITSKAWGNHQTPGWCLPLRLTGYSAYVTVMSGWCRHCLQQKLNLFYELVLLELPFPPYHRSRVVPAPTRRPCIQNSCLLLWPQSTGGLKPSVHLRWDSNPHARAWTQPESKLGLEPMSFNWDYTPGLRM